jgi:membrane-associated protein
MDIVQFLMQYILHIDVYLINFINQYGALTYALLFAIIFCETGLIIMPFLPGDSLLFASGSIAAQDNNPLNVVILFVLLVIASIVGNKLNYLVGKYAGSTIIQHNWLINRKHLQKTHEFYARHGGKTIIAARFLPIIRTFAPFVAGLGNMGWKEFSLYNAISAILWIGSLLSAGYFLGSLPIVRDNFSLVIYGIIMVSLLPAMILFLIRKFSPSKA